MELRRSTNMTIKHRIVCAVAALLLVYYVFAAYVLRYSLDRLVFPHTRGEHTSEIDRYRVADLNGNELIVRKYGNGKKGCAVFFPGQHGGIGRYEKTLFGPLVENGVTVFALTYPGQDGAAGNGNFSNVQGLIQKALTRINSSYPIKDSVFAGRSLGSMIAVMAAGQWHPRGLVLEGTAPALSDSVCSYMKSKWYLRPAALLPVHMIIKKDYLLTAALRNLTTTKTAIFQGDNDSLTPLEPIKKMIKEHHDVSLFAVSDATHSDAYIKALPLYIETISNMLNQKAPDKTLHTNGSLTHSRSNSCSQTIS